MVVVVMATFVSHDVPVEEGLLPTDLVGRPTDESPWFSSTHIEPLRLIHRPFNFVMKYLGRR